MLVSYYRAHTSRGKITDLGIEDEPVPKDDKVVSCQPVPTIVPELDRKPGGILWVQLVKREHKMILRVIIKQVIARVNLPEDTEIKEEIIRQRFKRGAIFCVNGKGRSSPLLPLEPMFVSIIIQMAQICQCLTPSEGIYMVKPLIKKYPRNKT